jgi:hypothetical protein
VTAIDELPFEQIWLADFEFISKAGEHPDVVCLCARELRSGQTLRLWRDQLGATAECACHLALGWPLPQKIFDLSPSVSLRRQRPRNAAR